MNKEDYNYINTLIYNSQYLDNELKKYIIGLTAETNNSWRTSKEEISILAKILASSNNIDLYFINDSLSDLEKKEITYIFEKYKKIYYPDESNIHETKPMNELLKMNTSLFRIKYQGGKYIEDYSDYEILLIFLIIYIEFKYYCSVIYNHLGTKKYPNYYKEATNKLYSLLKKVFNNNVKKLNNLISLLKEKYDKLRKKSKIIDNIDITNLFSDSNKELNELKRFFTDQMDLKSKIKLLFGSMYMSYRSFARDYILSNENNETNNREFNLEKFTYNYFKFININNPFSLSSHKRTYLPDELLKLELKLLDMNIIDNNQGNNNQGNSQFNNSIDNNKLLDYLKNKNKHGILGIAEPLRFMYELWYLYNFNSISTISDIRIDYRLKNDETVYTSCGLFSEINYSSNVFYHILQYKYNNDLVFPVRFFLTVKDILKPRKYAMDLSKLNNPDNSININLKEQIHEFLNKKDILAIIAIKNINEKGKLRIKFLFIKKIKGKSYSLISTYFKSGNKYALYDINGLKYSMGDIIPYKPITQLELHVLNNLFNNTCYSLKFKAPLNTDEFKTFLDDFEKKFTDKYKNDQSQYDDSSNNQLTNKNISKMYLDFKFKDYYDIDDENKIEWLKVYENHILFFSNYNVEKIIEYLKRDNILIDELREYKIELKEDERGKHEYFKLKLINIFNLSNNQMLGGKFKKTKKKDNKVVNIEIKNTKLNDMISIRNYFKNKWINNFDFPKYYKKYNDLLTNTNFRTLIYGDYKLWMYFNMKYADNLIMFINYFNSIYKYDLIKDKNIYENILEYNINELIQNNFINYKNKKIAELFYSKPYLINRIKEIKEYNLINLRFLKERKANYNQYITVDKSLDDKLKTKPIRYIKEYHNWNINIDNLLKNNNNLNLFMIREDIYKLTELNMNKVDILIVNNDFVFPLLNNVFRGYNMLYFIILVMICKYLNDGGTFIMDIRFLHIDKNYELLYLCQLLFKNVKLYNSELTMSYASKNTYIIATGFKNDMKTKLLITNILNEYEKLKTEYPDGIYNNKKGNLSYINTYLNIKLPNNVINKYNIIFNQKIKNVYNRSFKMYNDYLEYLKTDKFKFKVNKKLILDTLKYCQKYNVKISKKTYKIINNLPELKYIPYDMFSTI